MSTRSTIARRLDNGTFQAIYCHSDGYPSYNGRILFENYQDEAKIEALFGLGDLSLLGQEIGEAHDFSDYNHPHRYDWCLAYGRDRGEANTEARNYPTIHELNAYLADSDTEYVYIWNKGVWQWRPVTWSRGILDVAKQPELMPLTPEAWAREEEV